MKKRQIYGRMNGDSFGKKCMIMKEKKTPPIPNVAELESELKREKYKNRYWKVFRSTIYILITVAAVAVLVATLWLPVLQIYGSSMTPTLEEGDIVVSIKSIGIRSRCCISADVYPPSTARSRTVKFRGVGVVVARVDEGMNHPISVSVCRTIFLKS